MMQLAAKTFLTILTIRTTFLITATIQVVKRMKAAAAARHQEEEVVEVIINIGEEVTMTVDSEDLKVVTILKTAVV